MTRALGEAGLLSACTALDVPSICLLREVVAAGSGLADSMLALQGLGYGPIALAGDEAQQSEWRERVEQGRAIAAIAITEPNAGSDVASIASTARRVGDEYILEGRKCFITNAGIADYYVAILRTRRRGREGALGDRGAKGAGSPGRALCARRAASVRRARVRGARVPVSNRLGEEGEGFKIAMRTLDHFRPTVGAAANGMATRALSEAIERARTRRQFGKPIGTFQQIGAMLADAWTELEAGRLLVYRAALAHQRSDPMAGLYASAAKMFATEAAQRTIDRAVQVFGGEGVRRGNAVERLYRDIRALRIYEGTTEIQKIVMSRGLLGKI